jgi:hypothetical protein
VSSVHLLSSDFKSPTANIGTRSIKNDPSSTARLYAGLKKTWRIYRVKPLSHHMR